MFHLNDIQDKLLTLFEVINALSIYDKYDIKRLIAQQPKHL